MWSNQYHKPTIWAVVCLYHLFVVILSYSGDPSFITLPLFCLPHLPFDCWTKATGLPVWSTHGTSLVQPNSAIFRGEFMWGIRKRGESTWHDLGVPLLSGEFSFANWFPSSFRAPPSNTQVGLIEAPVADWFAANISPSRAVCECSLANLPGQEVKLTDRQNKCYGRLENLKHLIPVCHPQKARPTKGKWLSSYIILQKLHDLTSCILWKFTQPKILVPPIRFRCFCRASLNHQQLGWKIFLE